MEIHLSDIDFPIRVLHILGSLQRGGTEAVVYNYYRHIDKTRVQFDLAVDENSPCDVPKDIIDMGCHIWRIPSYARPIAYISVIRKLCREQKYKVVHSHMNVMSFFSLFAAWLGGVPIRISHSHSASANGKGELTRNILKHTLRPFSRVFATHYFACSIYAAHWLFGEKIVSERKVTILRNAISIERFKYDQEKREKVREQLGLSGKFVIGNVGRLSPQKNQLFLIDIFHAVTKLRNDVHLLIIGGIGSAGKGLEERLREKIEQYGISEKVSFLGSMEDISGMYQAMDVFVLPSLYEGLPVSVIEAQCSGLSCVISDRVSKEVKLNRNIMFLPLEESVERWAECITQNFGTRGDCSNTMRMTGYDILETARELEERYTTWGINVDSVS